jgi:hypothetical protein
MAGLGYRKRTNCILHLCSLWPTARRLHSVELDRGREPEPGISLRVPHVCSGLVWSRLPVLLAHPPLERRRGILPSADS